MTFTYSSIKFPLITSLIQDSQLICEFKSTDSTRILKAPLKKTHKKSQLVENIKRNLMSEVRRLAYQTAPEIR